MFCKALRELSETCGIQGSTLQNVENHIRSIYSVEVCTSYKSKNLSNITIRYRFYKTTNWFNLYFIFSGWPIYGIPGITPDCLEQGK